MSNQLFDKWVNIYYYKSSYNDVELKIYHINMKYINSTKGGFACFIIFLILTILIPGRGPQENVIIILTVSTFLFAILAGFFISRAGARFNEIRKMVGSEDALFLSLYKTAQICGKSLSNKIGNLIDKYYIVSYDSELSDYSYKETHPYFLNMWNEIIKMKKKDPIAYGRLLEILDDIEGSRNLASTISKEKISLGQWLVLIILAVVILFSLFYIKTTELYSSIITILLSTALVIILLILRDLQNLKFGGEKSLLEESGQEVLESMGKLRYYNQKYYKKGWYNIPRDVRQYRLGLHKPGQKLNIKVIKNEK